MPKITILMAVYNGERYLREAIGSILAQTYQNFEFLIINDGSTDGTRDVVLAYDDPRIRLFHNQQNLGLYRSLNRGLGLAHGRYVAIQDADDISEPERLAQQVAYLNAHAEVALLGTWYREIDANGALLGRGRPPRDHIDILWALLFFSPFVHSSVMFRREAVLEGIGFYDESLAYSADYDLWNRIAHVFPVANLNEYLVRYRVHPWSMTATYGERTKDGLRVRASNMARLLGWDPADVETEEVHFRKLLLFLFKPDLGLGSEETRSLAEDAIGLHFAFCRLYRISGRDCYSRCAKLGFQLTRNLRRLGLRIIRRPEASRNGRSREWLRSLRSYSLLARSYGWLLLRLLFLTASKGHGHTVDRE